METEHLLPDLAIGKISTMAFLARYNRMQHRATTHLNRPSKQHVRNCDLSTHCESSMAAELAFDEAGGENIEDDAGAGSGDQRWEVQPSVNLHEFSELVSVYGIYQHPFRPMRFVASFLYLEKHVTFGSYRKPFHHPSSQTDHPGSSPAPFNPKRMPRHW